MDAPRIGVIGAGIIGLAVARQMALLRPDASINVVEKEKGVAAHQSGRNSGVAHTGVYYTPGSLKAELCREGVGLLKDFCARSVLPYEEIGKTIVALTPVEVERLRAIEQRARINGVPGLRWLEPEELKEVEPHAAGLAGLHSPTTAIVDYRAVATALAQELSSAGGTVHLGCSVRRIRTSGCEAEVTAGNCEFVFDRLVICAGLQSDRLARLAGDEREPAIVPFRGEYYRLAPGSEGLVSGLLYPVPDPAYPFLGVHFTPRVRGAGVDVGPNAVLALAREGYRRRDVSPRDVWDLVSCRGLRSLARQHWRAGISEVVGSLSKHAFAARARSYLPDLATADLESAPAGVRAQAVAEDGTLVDDFRISRLGPVIVVRNAPSPGATSSLAIARHIASVALEALTDEPIPGLAPSPLDHDWVSD